MCQEGPTAKALLEVCVVCGKLKERHDVILAKDKELRADKEDFTGEKNEFGQCRTDSRVSLQADEAPQTQWGMQRLASASDHHPLIGIRIE